jgi:hypothetical protein
MTTAPSCGNPVSPQFCTICATFVETTSRAMCKHLHTPRCDAHLSITYVRYFGQWLASECSNERQAESHRPPSVPAGRHYLP